MKLEKTESGREAMRTRDERLSVRLRQLMVLANGEREVAELTQMSSASSQDVQNLLSWGFLAKAQSVVILRTESKTAANRVQTLSPSKTAEPSSIDLAHSQHPVAGAHRRSLAAAKLYMLGILEIFRHPSAIELRQSLHACSDAKTLVQTLMRCTSELKQHASEGYAARVAAQLHELLPIEHLEPWRNAQVVESAQL